MSKLSIITINLNDAAGIEKTLKSIWEKQSFRDFEHIVIDGGSKDGSVEVIKKYEKNLAYWISEPDKGIYNAMNKGIAKATGEYLLFINGGDWLADDVLAEVFAIPFEEDIVYGDFTYVSEDGALCPEIYKRELK
ncbi:MAG: glycosyltransferase family 2 protein, partial [Bacteroidales bacterium]